jgi:hypothetical protein
MTNTAVTFGAGRQGVADSATTTADRRASVAREEFNRLMGGAKGDNDTALRSQSRVDINQTGDKSRGEIVQQPRLVAFGDESRDPAPATLSNSSRTPTPRGSNGDPAPVSMHSRSNVAPATLLNVGTIGGSNGQSALFMNDQEKITVDTLRTTLDNRFPDGNMKAADLTQTFNIDPTMAQKFVRHHGTAGDPENLSNAAFVRHVERWQDEDGKLDRAQFESAIINGASHININRFEHEVGGGVEFRGFLEAYRRSGGNLPEEVLARIYNRFKDRNLKGDDEILDRQELISMGLEVNLAGDVSVAQFREALNALAFAQQNPAPPKPANDATKEQTQLPPAQDQAPKTGNNGGSQTIKTPNWAGTIVQQGNIQNNFTWPFPYNASIVQNGHFNNHSNAPMVGTMNSTGQSSTGLHSHQHPTNDAWRNNFNSIW